MIQQRPLFLGDRPERRYVSGWTYEIFEDRIIVDAAASLAISRVARSCEGRALTAERFGPTLTRERRTGDLLVVGGVHGDEPSSVEAVAALRAVLLREPPRSGLWVVTALNPDGLARGTKNNARDVDLNRNFPAGNFTRDHRPGYDPGPRPLSEPETAWLASLIDAEDVRGVVAVHAPFACVNFDGPAGPWADAVAAACGWSVRASLGYPTPGSLGSWFGVDRGRPILTLELPPGPIRSFAAAADSALRSAVHFWEQALEVAPRLP